MVQPPSDSERETCAWLLSRCGDLGITRVSSTTGLDRIGIPTHACVKPGTTDAIWVYSGKGLNDEQSQISAIVECVERTSALWREEAVVEGRVGVAESWMPSEFTERKQFVQDPQEVAWIVAHTVKDGRQVLVPAELAYVGRRPRSRAMSFRVSTSNGLGAGFDAEAAAYQAVKELIERDAVSLAELRCSHHAFSFLTSLGELVGHRAEDLETLFVDDCSPVRRIQPESVPPLARRLLNMFMSSGLTVRLTYVPSDIGLPVFAAASAEQTSVGAVLATAGFGADLDPEVALVGAILELAQSRATELQGAREDCLDLTKRRWSQRRDSHWLLSEQGHEISFAEVPHPRVRGPRLEWLQERLAAVGLGRLALYWLQTAPGFYVARAFVPGVETWHATGGLSDLGPRARQLLGLPSRC